MKKFPKFLAAGAMALTVLAGCGSEGAGSTVELKDGDTVKVGLNYELSGSTATYGLAMDKGSKLAIKQYNENENSKYKIEVVSQDCKSDSTEAQSIASKLMTEEKVAFQVGPATSIDSIATYPISTDAGVPVIRPLHRTAVCWTAAEQLIRMLGVYALKIMHRLMPWRFLHTIH